MRAIFIVCIVVLLGVSSAIAQKPPGYLGKRTLIGVCYDYSPGYGDYFNLTHLRQDYSFSDFVMPNPRVGIMLKHVIKNNKTLNLSVNYQGGTIAKNVDLDSYSNPGNSYLNYFKSSTITYTLGLSDHQSNVAPMGTYVSKGIIFAQINSTYKLGNSPEANRKLADLGLQWGYGVRRIFYDKMAVDFGAEVNVYFIGLIENLGSLSEFQESSFENEYPERAANALNNLVVIRFGVSYLL